MDVTQDERRKRTYIFENNDIKVCSSIFLENAFKGLKIISILIRKGNKIKIVKLTI